MNSPCKIPQGAVTWSITDIKNAVRLGSANEDGVHAHEWAIDELTTENVKRHWNHGTFRVTFFGKRKSGARFPKGNEVFTIEPQRAAAPPAPAPVVQQQMFDPMAGIDPNLRMMMMFRQQAKDEAKESQNSTLQLLAGLGQVMKGLRGEGPGAETVALTNAVNQIAGVVNQLAAEMANLKSNAGDDDEEEEDDEDNFQVVKDGKLNTDGLINAALPKAIQLGTMLMDQKVASMQAQQAAAATPSSPPPPMTQQTQQTEGGAV